MLKNKFKQNEWDMISHIESKGKSNTWLELAIRFGIRVDGNSEQRKKSANDVWRKYKKFSNRNEKKIKILIYDIEITKTPFELWWSGEQFVNGNNSIRDSRIISISYKWLYSDLVHNITWKNKSDKDLMKEFLAVYNEADMVIGINNNKFDNKFINARSAKYNLDVNLHIKSLDVQKEVRRLFRLPSYSMKYLGKYFDLPQQKMKVHLEDLWEDIMYGTKKQAKKAMKKVVKYNNIDVLTTEQLYLRLLKYLKHPIHIGVFEGESKISCPICGGNHIEHYKTTITTAGTVQRIMKCKEDSHLYKVSNSEYLRYEKEKR